MEIVTPSKILRLKPKTFEDFVLFVFTFFVPSLIFFFHFFSIFFCSCFFCFFISFSFRSFFHFFEVYFFFLFRVFHIFLFFFSDAQNGEKLVEEVPTVKTTISFLKLRFWGLGAR